LVVIARFNSLASQNVKALVSNTIINKLEVEISGIIFGAFHAVEYL
jgi:hypothetical protein